MPTDDLDAVFKALADPTRRAILDLLRGGPRLTNAIVEQFPDLSRFGVMKHLDVLKHANLVLARKEGRTVINSLNAVPIQQINERWVSRFAGQWATTILRVKDDAEQGSRGSES